MSHQSIHAVTEATPNMIRKSIHWEVIYFDYWINK